MPVTPTYPGVYIDEIPSGVRTITPVATSITAFIGSAPRGLTNDPRKGQVNSFADYQRQFGGLHVGSPMSYAVSHYFQNGGSVALIIRVVHSDAVAAKLALGGLQLEVASQGIWGNKVRARTDFKTKKPDDKTIFNLSLYDTESRTEEQFRNVSTDPNDPRFVRIVLEENSFLARIPKGQNPSPPDASGDGKAGLPWFDNDNAGAFTQAAGGVDGQNIDEADILGVEADKTGIFALENTNLFNILCLPPPTFQADIQPNTYAQALTFCKRRRAMLLVDPSGDWSTVAGAANGLRSLQQPLGGETLTRNAALYFPRIRVPDPLRENRLGTFVPCGAVAGIFARTDAARGVWKAPAGIEAGLTGVNDFTVTMTDPENGTLNPLGVNCLRSFNVYGNVVWGSRTLAGNDDLGSEWKYVPVRRFTLFLEESLYRGTQWCVFEPNDEPLWSQIRLNIGAFMHDLFRQGAFQGRTSSEAYFVKCDKETTTQSDINRGIVNIIVGFAPLKPAEFVIIHFQQIAGKIET